MDSSFGFFSSSVFLNFFFIYGIKIKMVVVISKLEAACVVSRAQFFNHCNAHIYFYNILSNIHCIFHPSSFFLGRYMQRIYFMGQFVSVSAQCSFNVEHTNKHNLKLIGKNCCLIVCLDHMFDHQRLKTKAIQLVYLSFCNGHHRKLILDYSHCNIKFNLRCGSILVTFKNIE